MILQSRHRLGTDRPLPLADIRPGNSFLHYAVAPGENAPVSKLGGWFAGLFGFWCMNPYPSINFGNNTAITIGNILTWLSIFVVFNRSCRNKPYFLFIVLMVPLWIATMSSALIGVGDPSLCVKVDTMRTMAYATMIAAQFLIPNYFLEILTGIAIACILHFMVGMYQLYAFASHVFPLEWLYNNKSFLSVQDMTKTIAKYIQRPFGIFPEPSAMSSSLAPWVIVWIGEMCGVIRFVRAPSLLQRALFACGAMGSLMLIIMSRSGHTAVTLVPVIIFALVWLKNCRATPKNVAIIVVGLIISGFVISMGIDVMSERLGGKGNVGNSSWDDRFNSLIAGFKMVVHHGFQTMVFGVGPGNTSPILYELSNYEAVWSVILTYIYETGIVGLIACVWVGAYVVQVWIKTRFNIVLASLVFVWFIGILLTTSYDQLQPIWIALGWITVWPTVIANPVKATADQQQGFPASYSRGTHGN